MKLRSPQKKGLSEFLNTIAAAWFTAGIISPVFLISQNLARSLVLAMVSLSFTVYLLTRSLKLLERVK